LYSTSSGFNDCSDAIATEVAPCDLLTLVTTTVEALLLTGDCRVGLLGELEIAFFKFHSATLDNLGVEVSTDKATGGRAVDTDDDTGTDDKAGDNGLAEVEEEVAWFDFILFHSATLDGDRAGVDIPLGDKSSLGTCTLEGEVFEGEEDTDADADSGTVDISEVEIVGGTGVTGLTDLDPAATFFACIHSATFETFGVGLV